MAESSTAAIRRTGRLGNALRPMRKHRVHPAVEPVPLGSGAANEMVSCGRAKLAHPAHLRRLDARLSGLPPRPARRRGMRRPESLALTLRPGAQSGAQRPTGTKGLTRGKKNMKKPLGEQNHLWYSVFAFVALVSPLDV
jgi:hypothetical protein